MRTSTLLAAVAAAITTLALTPVAFAAGPPGPNASGANCRGQFIAGNTFSTGVNIEGAADVFFGGSVRAAQLFLHTTVCVKP